MDQGFTVQQMYQEYARPVYLYLLSLCRDEKTAEDLTQETFYQAMKSIRRYDGSCRLMTWLCQIGKHLWYQEAKKRRKRGVSVPLEEDLAAAPDENVDSLENDENRVSLFRAMQALEPTAREVVYLRVMGDLSFRQIGDILGKTENWARVTFYRAKERLRKGWDQNE